MNNGYSVCFNEWALDKEIKDELGLLLIISSLCAEKGYCWATNEFFANLFEVTEVTISRKIKKLEEKGYLTIEYEKRGCEVKNRTLRLTNMLIHDYHLCKSTINKNVKENNININNININNKKENIIKEKSCVDKSDTIKEIIDYMNKLGGTSFKATTSKTQKLISARLSEGFNIEDFKDVIYFKYKKWVEVETEFSNGVLSSTYYRPDTLFGTKFESYLQEYKRQL